MTDADNATIDPVQPPPVLARVVAALQGHGRLVETDWDTDTFEVYPNDLGEGDSDIPMEPSVGVVLSHAQRVVFYTVWPDPIPADRMAAVSEAAHRINTELHTSALEFNVDSGVLAARAGFEFAGLAGIARDIEGVLVHNCLLETESVYHEYAPVIAAVTGGATAIDALADLA